MRGKSDSAGLAVRAVAFASPAASVRAASPEPTTGTQAAPQAALPAVDVLRFVSVCAVVWYHVGGPGSDLFSFRLPAIALITAFVQSRSRTWHPRGVLVPWAFWYGAHLAVLGYKVLVHGAAASPPGLMADALKGWWNPLVGPAWHLWYGPFALIAGYLVHRFKAVPRAGLWLAAAAALAAGVALRSAPFPANQWGRILPAIPIGMLLARAETRLVDVALVGALATLVLGPQYAVAIVLVRLAAAWKGPRLKQLATFSRGVYWSHILVIEVLFKVGLEYAVWPLLGSFVAAALLMVTPRGRRLI